MSVSFFRSGRKKKKNEALLECNCKLDICILPFIIVLSAEVELMKERFAKLLLGEDMSGGGKGVCTALAISNAITNLSGLYKLWSSWFESLFPYNFPQNPSYSF